SRLAEMPLRAMGLLRVCVLGRVFLFDAFGALGRAAFQKLVGQRELGVGDPGEGDQHGLVRSGFVDAHRVALDPGDEALEALAPVGHAIELDPGLQALVGLEVLDAGQRPVDAGARHLQRIVAADRVGALQHVEDRARQLRAVLDPHLAGRVLGHHLQRAPLAAADQAQAHHRITHRLGERVDEVEQQAIFTGLGAQGSEPTKKRPILSDRRSKTPSGANDRCDANIGSRRARVSPPQSAASSITFPSGSRMKTARVPRRPLSGTPAAASAASTAARSPTCNAMWVMPACFSGTSISTFGARASGALTMKLISSPDGWRTAATLSAPCGPQAWANPSRS